MEQFKKLLNSITDYVRGLAIKVAQWIASVATVENLKKLALYIVNLIVSLVVSAAQPMIKIAKKHPIAFSFAMIFHIALVVGLINSNVEYWKMPEPPKGVQQEAPTKAVTIDVEVIKAEREKLADLEKQKQKKLASDIQRSEAAKKAQKHAEEHRRAEEKKAKEAIKKKELAEKKAKEAAKKKEKEEAKAKEAFKKKELAEKKAKEADKQKALAEEKTREAEAKAQKAESKAAEAAKIKELAEEKTREELAKAEEAAKKKELAEAKAKEAAKQKTLAEEKTQEELAKAKEATKKKELAEKKAKEAAKQKALAEEKTREELAKAKEAAKNKELAEAKAKEAEKKEAIAKQLTEEARKKKEALEAERIAIQEKFEDDQNIRALITDLQDEVDADRRQMLEDILNELKESYISQIAIRVKKVWRYDAAEDHWGCDVHIVQSEEGEVLFVNLQNCRIDDSSKAVSFKNSIERAVYKASPLPMAPEKEIFDPDVLFYFRVN